jgi:anti-sigma factor RsiW
MNRDKDAGIPDVILERYRLGELPAEQAAHVEQRLQADQALRRRLGELELSDQEIRRRYPPEWLADRIRERLRPDHRATPRPRLAWLRRWPLPAALATAAVVLLVLAPRTFGPPPTGSRVTPSATPASPDRVRIKGLKPSLVLFRRTAEGSETLADGVLVHQGDQIRVGYRAAGYAYGAIVSVDGRGVVSVHLAADAAQASPLRSGETVLLDQAFELDDAPLWERFYFVVAEQPFAVAPIVEAVRRAAAQRTPGPTPSLALSSRYQQYVIGLMKEGRP